MLLLQAAGCRPFVVFLLQSDPDAYMKRPFQKLLIDGQTSHMFKVLVLNLVCGFNLGGVYKVSGLIHMIKSLIFEAISKFLG